MDNRNSSPEPDSQRIVEAWDYEASGETDAPSYIKGLELVAGSKQLKRLMQSQRIYLHASGSAFWPYDTDFPDKTLKQLQRSLSTCAYFRQTTQIGRDRAAFFTAVIQQNGYIVEYCKDGHYAYDMPSCPDGGRGFVAAYRDYETKAQDYQRKAHIAVITDPDFRSLMELADFSIVLCTLPHAYDKYEQLQLLDGVPAWAVFNKLQNMVVSQREEDNRAELDNLKRAVHDFLPFTQLTEKAETRR